MVSLSGMIEMTMINWNSLRMMNTRVVKMKKTVKTCSPMRKSIYSFTAMYKMLYT